MALARPSLPTGTRVMPSLWQGRRRAPRSFAPGQGSRGRSKSRSKDRSRRRIRGRSKGRSRGRSRERSKGRSSLVKGSRYYTYYIYLYRFRSLDEGRSPEF